MARVTVEDCVVVVPNRFELCLIASNRAKSVLSGAATQFDKTEKSAVIALREIGDNIIDVDAVRSNITQGIKNRGASEYNDLISDENNTSNIVNQETENQNISLKESTFMEDNIQIND
jgi:DNA-directed RNA polymerase subunit omega